MASPRDEPFVWVTWLSGLLSGATTCEWAAWFKAHHFYEKRLREGDLAMYQIQHTTLLMQVRDRLSSVMTDAWFRRNGRTSSGCGDRWAFWPVDPTWSR